MRACDSLTLAYAYMDVIYNSKDLDSVPTSDSESDRLGALVEMWHRLLLWLTCSWDFVFERTHKFMYVC